MWSIGKVPIPPVLTPSTGSAASAALDDASNNVTPSTVSPSTVSAELNDALSNVTLSSSDTKLPMLPNEVLFLIIASVQDRPTLSKLRLMSSACNDEIKKKKRQELFGTITKTYLPSSLSVVPELAGSDWSDDVRTFAIKTPDLTESLTEDSLLRTWNDNAIVHSQVDKAVRRFRNLKRIEMHFMIDIDRTVTVQEGGPYHPLRRMFGRSLIAMTGHKAKVLKIKALDFNICVGLHHLVWTGFDTTYAMSSGRTELGDNIIQEVKYEGNDVVELSARCSNTIGTPISLGRPYLDVQPSMGGTAVASPSLVSLHLDSISICANPLAGWIQNSGTRLLDLRLCTIELSRGLWTQVFQTAHSCSSLRRLDLGGLRYAFDRRGDYRGYPRSLTPVSAVFPDWKADTDPTELRSLLTRLQQSPSLQMNSACQALLEDTSL